MLDSIDDKINQSRDEMHNIITQYSIRSLSIEIEALEWVQLQIKHLVNSKAEKRINQTKLQ